MSSPESPRAPLPEPEDPNDPIFLLASQAMQAHILQQTWATTHNPLHPPDANLLPLTELGQASPRHSDWPHIFEGALYAAWAARQSYGNYWRLQIGMLPPKINPELDGDERVAIAQLMGAITFSRVPLVDTGNDAVPSMPAADACRADWRRLQLELRAQPGSFELPHITWNSMIRAMLDGQVQVGPAE